MSNDVGNVKTHTFSVQAAGAGSHQPKSRRRVRPAWAQDRRRKSSGDPEGGRYQPAGMLVKPFRLAAMLEEVRRVLRAQRARS